MDNKNCAIDIGNNSGSIPQLGSIIYKSSEPLFPEQMHQSKQFKESLDQVPKNQVSKQENSPVPSPKPESIPEVNPKLTLRFRASNTVKEIEKDSEVKLYEIWPGKNQFVCYGKFITGPRSDLIYVGIVWFIILAVSIVYGILVIPYLTRNLTQLFLFVLSATIQRY